jgi:hypothetical protein
MREKLLNKDKANKVYDLLVSIGGADERMRTSFVYHHCESEYGCDEWRFQGKLGFGGKYYSRGNKVCLYKEDETPERNEIRSHLNSELQKK